MKKPTKKSISAYQGGSILSRQKRNTVVLPTLCEACHCVLIDAIDQAKGYPFAGIYCSHRQTLAQAELNVEMGDLVGMSLHGPLTAEQAEVLIDDSFDMSGPVGSTLVGEPGGCQ